MKGAAQGFYASVIREGIRLPYKTANPEQEKRETEKKGKKVNRKGKRSAFALATRKIIYKIQ